MVNTASVLRAYSARILGRPAWGFPN